jgi:hypothetical protein
LGKPCKPSDLVRADHIECQQHVGNARGGHHLGLAQLLHGNASRTQFKLRQCKRNQLVRLDVGTVGDAKRIAMRLPAQQISLDHGEIDDRHGRFQIGKRPAGILELKVLLKVHAAVSHSIGPGGN